MPERLPHPSKGSRARAFYRLLLGVAVIEVLLVPTCIALGVSAIASLLWLIAAVMTIAIARRYWVRIVRQ
jgi:hypothetical protein